MRTFLACIVLIVLCDTCMGGKKNKASKADKLAPINTLTGKLTETNIQLQALDVALREHTKISCNERLAKVEANYKAQPGLVGLERPHCDADGSYRGMQYAGSKAHCVTKSGTAISGYMVNRWETGDDMNCQCARDQYDYIQTGLIGKTYSCEKNGNYASVGCSGSVCYCQDKNGKQIGTSTVFIGSTDSLNC